MSNVKQIIQRVGAYLGDVGVEFRKIAWPDRQELVDSTVVVIAFIVILAVVSGLGSSLSPRRWRFGHLPGDLHFDLFGRHIHIPLTSTLLLSLLVGLLIRWL